MPTLSGRPWSHPDLQPRLLWDCASPIGHLDLRRVDTPSCPRRTWDALVSSLSAASIQVFTCGQKSSLLIWDFSMKLHHLSFFIIVSDCSLYLPQLEFMQSFFFFFFFNLKNWICQPGNKVSKGAGFVLQMISVAQHLVINCCLDRGMNE